MNVGDRVRLTSGGPVMTVAAIVSGTATCIFWNADRRSPRFEWVTCAKNALTVVP